MANRYGSLDDNVQNPMLDSFPPASANAGANFARLCMLVMDEGSRLVAERVLENLPPCQSLEDVLQAKSSTIESLLNRNLLSMEQISMLYPNDGPINQAKIDLALWILLLRNITTNAKSINKKWAPRPDDWQLKYWHDFERLRKIRNTIVHNGKAAITEETFHQLWNDATDALERLGVSPDVIDSYKTRDIDPERARQIELYVKEEHINYLRLRLKEKESQDRKSKILLGASVVVIIILVTVSIVVPFVISHNMWKSCADNIQYNNSDYAMVGYLTREGWGARNPAKKMDPLNRPAKYVIISHTAQVTTPCATTDDCCSTVREIQRFNIDTSNFADIAYNYVIGGNGIVFIGRGPDYQPSMALGWNNQSIGIGFIGLFTRMPPKDEALNALTIYLDILVNSTVLDPNYTLYGLCQVREKFHYAPGAAFMNVLEDMFPDHWKNDNITNCYADRGGSLK